MVRLPVALTIAGSDSGGGAGIQADLKTFEACGVFGTSAITAITAQNTQGVKSIQEIDPQIVRDQIDQVVEDLHPAVAKTGMLSSADIIQTVADAIRHHKLRVVVDPVMVAKSGAKLLKDDAVETLRDTLLPLAEVITPNLPEAQVLTGLEVRTEDQMQEALTRLQKMGPTAVLLKGGHLNGPEVVDLLWDGREVHRFAHARIQTKNTHGTGCTMASAIAASLARGLSLQQSVLDAESLVERGLRYGLALGDGHGPVHHLAALRNAAARGDVLASVAQAVARLEQENPVGLVPEVGINLVACTPYAIGHGDVAAIQGRIIRMVDPQRGDRVHAVGSAAFGASRHMASFLLALRDCLAPENVKTVGAAMNARYGDDVQQALDALGWDVAFFDRAQEPPEVKAREGATMPWAARQVMQGRTQAPQVVVDLAEAGKERLIKVLGANPEGVTQRALEIDRRLRSI